MDLVGSNPVFGLNALGGALSVRLKNGFTHHGGEIDLLGGSFSHYQGELQYGVQSGNTAAYAAATGLHEGGWRDLQSSNVRNFYGDIGWRGSRGEAHVNVTSADNTLNGPGTSPIELLAVNPSAQFTAPNLIKNKYALVTLSGSYDITDTTALQGVAYYEYFLQKVVNGNVPLASPCTDEDQAGFLCVVPEVFATNRAGNPIPDFLNGGPYSDLDQQSTNTNGYGASLQATNRDELFGHPNPLGVWRRWPSWAEKIDRSGTIIHRCSRLKRFGTTLRIHMAIIVIGGQSRDVGKTSVVAGIIAALPSYNWTAFKITQFGHGRCSLDGKPCDCATDDRCWAITEEKDLREESDTSRFLAAGAKRSFWVRTEQGRSLEALPVLRRRLAAERKRDYRIQQHRGIYSAGFVHFSAGSCGRRFQGYSANGCSSAQMR